METRIEKKIMWIERTASASFGILIFTLVINYFREPLFGIKEGYAPHNFTFNFIFFFPAMFLSFTFGMVAFGRTLKHWKSWTNLNRKLLFIALSTPVILLWVFQIIRIFIY